MKVLSLLFLPYLLLLSCTKSERMQPVQPPAIEKDIQISGPLPIPWRPRLRMVCINSYSEAVQYLGGQTIRARQVILENGTVIQVTGPIESITYGVSDQKAPTSLFSSHFEVIHTYYGTPQAHSTETWSLGCTLVHAGKGPFTNILKDGTLLQVNTAIVWTVPPYQTQELRIAFIIV